MTFQRPLNSSMLGDELEDLRGDDYIVDFIHACIQ